MLKKILIINLFFLVSFCFSHEKQNADLYLSLQGNNKIKIEIKEFRTKNEMFFNQIKIISMKSNQILDEFFLDKSNQILEIPNEEYYVLVQIGNSLVSKQGIYYKESLKNSVDYLNFFMLINILLFFISLVLFNFRIKKYKIKSINLQN